MTFRPGDAAAVRRNQSTWKIQEITRKSKRTYGRKRLYTKEQTERRKTREAGDSRKQKINERKIAASYAPKNPWGHMDPNH